MKRIIENRKLFGVTHEADLGQLKSIYRNLIKEWHPDKFRENDELFTEAEVKSKQIIEAYHFLVSISPENHAQNSERYTNTTTNSSINDYSYKGQTLKIFFHDGSIYEYFGVPKNVINKLSGSSTATRFARRHIFHSYTFRNVSKVNEE